MERWEPVRVRESGSKGVRPQKDRLIGLGAHGTHGVRANLYRCNRVERWSDGDIAM